MVDSLAKTFKRDNFTAFGGMQVRARLQTTNLPNQTWWRQLILTGDFFQLPPVTENNQPIKFAFETKAWQDAIKHTFVLNKVYRQKDEGTHLHWPLMS